MFTISSLLLLVTGHSRGRELPFHHFWCVPMLSLSLLWDLLVFHLFLLLSPSEIFMLYDFFSPRTKQCAMFTLYLCIAVDKIIIPLQMKSLWFPKHPPIFRSSRVLACSCPMQNAF